MTDTQRHAAAKQFVAELPYSQRPPVDRHLQLYGVLRLRHGVAHRRPGDYQKDVTSPRLC